MSAGSALKGIEWKFKWVQTKEQTIILVTDLKTNRFISNRSDCIYHGDTIFFGHLSP